MRVLDLCCGLGGWAEGFLAEGWDVFGVDVEKMPYPGPMVIADVRTLPAAAIEGPFDLVVASPPCTEFSRWDMPCWFDLATLDPPDRSIWRSCERIARELNLPLVLENVRGAQKFMGRALWHWDGCYLWGDGVPPVRCHVRKTNRKGRLSSSRRMERAMIPLELARYIASYHRGW